MNQEEVDELEGKLDLTLPETYKQLVLNHPGFYRQHELCDHVDPLVYDNRDLRRKGFFGIDWPADYFVIGSDGTGNFYFITTAPFDGHVYLADHDGGAGPDDLDAAKAFESLDDFVTMLREMRVLMVEDIKRTNARIDRRKWWEFWIPTEKGVLLPGEE